MVALDSEMQCQSLDLANMLLTDSDILPVSQSLQGFTLITTLMLSGNSIGDKGIKLFGPILKNAHNLIAIDLANNGITKDGLNDLVDSLFSAIATEAYNVRYYCVIRFQFFLTNFLFELKCTYNIIYRPL